MTSVKQRTKRHHFSNQLVWLGAFCAILVMAGDSASADGGRYVLKKGDQYALCRDYVAALNAAERKFPMACERHFPPQFDKFAKPKWTALDPHAQPKDLYRQMYLVWYEREALDEGWKKVWENRMMPALEADTLQLDRTRVDIDNTGDRETVLRFAYRPCEESLEWFQKGPFPTTYRYFVVNDKSGKLDDAYDILSQFRPHGLFYYEGRTFLDSFGGLPLDQSIRYQRKRGSPAYRLYVKEPRGPVSPPTPKRPFGQSFGRRHVCTVEFYFDLSGTEVEENRGGKQ